MPRFIFFMESDAAAAANTQAEEATRTSPSSEAEAAEARCIEARVEDDTRAQAGECLTALARLS